MHILIFLKALLIGFALAIPTGPVGVLCINATLEKNQKAGLVLGLGSAMADLFYTFLIVGSLGSVILFLEEYRIAIKIVAFLLISFMGWRVLHQKVGKKIEYSLSGGIKDFFTGFSLTITNPTVIMSFLIAFTHFGLHVDEFSMMGKIYMIAGVFLGSLLWWITLSSLVRIFRTKMKNTLLRKINIFSACILFAFALIILVYDVVLKYIS